MVTEALRYTWMPVIQTSILILRYTHFHLKINAALLKNYC